MRISTTSLVALSLGLTCIQGCRNEAPVEVKTTPQVVTENSSDASKSGQDVSRNKIARIEKFCGDCHPLPLASTFPKSSWIEEVRQGFDFYIESKRTDLEEPLRQDVVRYYQEAAPDKIGCSASRRNEVRAFSDYFPSDNRIGPR